MSKTLNEIREHIDKVDDDIARALVERAKLAQEVRNVKQGQDLQVYHPSRERDILDRVFKICKDSGFTIKQVDQIFLSIISACRSIVGDIEVCIMGPVNSLSHAAVVSQFGPIDQIYSAENLSEVFARVEAGSSQYGIVPVSRGEDGIFGETLFAFLSSSEKIIAEVVVKNLEFTPPVDERFFVIGKPDGVRNRHNVIALICVVKDRSGVLREILEPFEKHNLTLLALESRTSKDKKWECAFYIEVKSEPDSLDFANVIHQLNSRCLFVRILGSFYRG